MSRLTSSAMLAAALVLLGCGTDTTAPDLELLKSSATPEAAARVYRYYGCGDTYGTCALALVSAQELSDGRVSLTGTLESRAFQAAKFEHRNAMLQYLWVGEETGPFGSTVVINGWRDTDCGGCNDYPGPSVIFYEFSGLLDPRCERITRCRDLSMMDYFDYGDPASPWTYPIEFDFVYQTEPISFTAVLATWDTPLVVQQSYVGGDERQWETYELTKRGNPSI